MHLPSILAHRSSFLPIAGEPPPRRPPAPPRAVVSPPPVACVRLGPSDGHERPRSKGGRWIGPRWTGGPSPQAPIHGPHQPRVMLASAWPLTARHVALPQPLGRLPFQFLQKEPCSFQNYMNALPPIEILSVRSCFQRLSPCPS
jgi:hypothetical protein